MSLDRKLGIGGLAFGIIGIGLSMVETVYPKIEGINPCINDAILGIMLVGGLALISLGAYLIVKMVKNSDESMIEQL